MNHFAENEYLINTEEQMMNIGAQLTKVLHKFGIITLEGELGAGKTTFVRGFLRELGYQGNVKSPTYTLVEPYRIDGKDIYHFDLYRLTEPDELEYMGFRDYLSEDAVCLIEWPDKGGDYIPEPDMRIKISIIKGTKRKLTILKKQ